MNAQEVLVDGTYFSFPTSWEVTVFDEWPQYGKFKSAGVQGCDVLAIDNKDLWIIEMKDYTYLEAKQPQDLHVTVGRKAAGTMALLYSLARSPAESTAREFARKCSSIERINLALHVEPKAAGKQAKQVAAALMPLYDRVKSVSKALHINKSYVTSTLAPDASTPWTARRDPATRHRHQNY